MSKKKPSIISLNVRFLVICMLSIRFLCFSYIVILSAAKNLRPHHNTCAIKRALRLHCHSERSEESQCPVCICRYPIVQLSSSLIQLNTTQQQISDTGEYETEFKADIHSIGRIEQIGDGTYIVDLCCSK